MRDKKHGSSVKKQSGRYRQRYKQVMLNRFIFAGIIIIIVLLGTIIGIKKYRAGLDENTKDNKNNSEAVNNNADDDNKNNDKNSDKPDNSFVNSAANHKEDGKRIVCIDAGYGGRDVGAEGDGTGYEKDDTLKMALALKSALEKQGVTVYMTRDSDKTVSKEERVQLANDVKADLLVSLHRNEYGDSGVRGFEAWVHSSKPKDSTDAAEKIQNALKNTGYIKNRGVKFGSQTSENEDLYINNHSVGPSVLLEMGFMSNSDDNNLYRNKTEELADAVGKGIVEWLAAQGL